MNKVAWLLTAVYLSWSLHHAGVMAESRIRLNAQFRFEDILIARKEGSSEDFFTRTNINLLGRFFSQLSIMMAKATEAINRRISVQVIRVLVPNSKVADLKAANFTFVPATWEPAAVADIWLTDSSNVKAIPASVCYGRNEFIELPTNHIKSLGNVYLLLREFTKFRWGALNETDNKHEFTREYSHQLCSANIAGHYKLNSSDDLTSDYKECENKMYELDSISQQTFDELCDFVPLVGGNAGKQASIMSHTGAELFCDNSTGNLTSHNTKARNSHNEWCGNKSVAEVLWEHADFSRSANGTATSDTEPTILLVEPYGVRQVVLVLDLSGSMAGNRIRNLIRGAALYVEFFVELGAEVAIVTFNETARVIQPMMKIANSTDRQILTDKIKGMVAKGATNIAEGITLAMGQLNARAPYAKTQIGFVILITDGVHNVGPPLDNAISNATLTSIVFDVVCISAAADARMNNLARSTGGLSMFSAETAPLSNEMEVAFARLAERSANSKSKPVMLRSAVTTLPIQSEVVLIDGSVTKSLRFILNLPSLDVSSINFTVQSPNGTVYGVAMGSAVYKADTAISTLIITIPDSDIQAGNWTMNADYSSATGRRKRRAVEILNRKRRSTSSGSVTVVGVSDSSSSLNINLHTFLQLTSIPQVTLASVQRIFAYVTNNSAPLLNAVIEASVSPASGAAFIVSLKDDGLGYDLTANDGIYVGVVYPNKMTSVGDYGVTVVMTSPIGRVTSAGKFRVESLATGSVVMPPGRITDLSAVGSIKNQSVLISFTSPGNQAYDGVPASYEIRASNSFDQISTSFGSTALVASLPGQAVGTKIQLMAWAANFTSVNTNITFYLAASTVSTGGLKGEASFPTSTMLAYPNGWVPRPITTSTTYTTTSTTPSTTSTSTSTSTVATISTRTPTTNPVPTAEAVTQRSPVTTTTVASTSSNRTDVTGHNWSPGVVAGVAVLTIALIAQIIAILVVAAVLR